MEIGSFIELQFEKNREYYKGNVARLNTGRAAIYHAFRVTKCKSIWLPVYQCDTVRDFLIKKEIKINYYHIDKNYNPIDLYPLDDEAVLIVNYYGIMSRERMHDLASGFKNVIVDNSQAFFCNPIENCLMVYSCRKFLGVPDGAYVIGNGCTKYLDEYSQGYSSDTSLFLLQRIEYGCEGKAYSSRKLNENRIDNEDILLMSKLTHTILDSIDYQMIIKKRLANFEYACSLFNSINQIDPQMYFDKKTTVPMIYPLVIENYRLLSILQDNKHFQGHWWSYLLDETDDNMFEHWISKYVIPITIDQRYGKEELDYIYRLIRRVIDE